MENEKSKFLTLNSVCLIFRFRADDFFMKTLCVVSSTQGHRVSRVLLPKVRS